jgi:hypothetical protein
MSCSTSACLVRFSKVKLQVQNKSFCQQRLWWVPKTRGDARKKSPHTRRKRPDRRRARYSFAAVAPLWRRPRQRLAARPCRQTCSMPTCCDVRICVHSDVFRCRRGESSRSSLSLSLSHANRSILPKHGFDARHASGAHAERRRCVEPNHVRRMLIFYAFTLCCASWHFLLRLFSSVAVF